jgi:hypothetical protein
MHTGIVASGRVLNLAVSWQSEKTYAEYWVNEMKPHFLIVRLFVVYLTTFDSRYSSIASDEGVISAWWIEKDVEGNGRGLIFDSISAFAGAGLAQAV